MSCLPMAKFIPLYQYGYFSFVCVGRYIYVEINTIFDAESNYLTKMIGF